MINLSIQMIRTSSKHNSLFIMIINVFDKNSIPWQTGELGKVDAGGGGTISAYMAKHGMNVIDAGVAVLNMHAPWEAISKADLYEAYRGYVSFLQNIDFRNE